MLTRTGATPKLTSWRRPLAPRMIAWALSSRFKGWWQAQGRSGASFELAVSRTTDARIGLFKNAADDRRQENHYADKQQSGNYLFAQGNPERSTALIEFGGPHSS